MVIMIFSQVTIIINNTKTEYSIVCTLRSQMGRMNNSITLVPKEYFKQNYVDSHNSQSVDIKKI